MKFFKSKTSTLHTPAKPEICLHPLLKQEKAYDFTPSKASITTICGLCDKILDVDNSGQRRVDLMSGQSPYQAILSQHLG